MNATTVLLGIGIHICVEKCVLQNMKYFDRICEYIVLVDLANDACSKSVTVLWREAGTEGFDPALCSRKVPGARLPLSENEISDPLLYW